MSRGGKAKTRDLPERRCIATGDVRPQSELIRFVAGPDGQLVLDVAGKLPGRGIWVSAQRSALEKAEKKGLFARAAGQTVTIPEGFVDGIEALLANRVQTLISLARKAGSAVAGYEKVKGWLATGEAVMLLQASDGSERGKTRLRPPEGEGSFSGVLTASELGLAFGREHVIHAALAAGGLTDKVRVDVMRLSGVRDSGDGTGGASAGKAKKTV